MSSFLRVSASSVAASAGFLLPRLFACLVACNYGAFRVELFAEEYEHAHPSHAGATESVSSSSTTWESFDKDNAPKAFVFDAEIMLTILGVQSDVFVPSAPNLSSFELIRDKSPPAILPS